jgi:hypothetical protein
LLLALAIAVRTLAARNERSSHSGMVR